MNAFILFIVGALFISGGNIDLMNGLFLLHGSARDWQVNCSFILTTFWTITVTMIIPMKKRLLLFAYVSLYSMIDHAVLFWMVQNTVENTIPIKESLPLIKIAYYDYINLFGIRTIVVHLFALLTTCLYFIFIMFLILRIKAMYHEGKIYWEKRKW